MTLEEALACVEGDGPAGEGSDRLKQRQEVIDAFDNADVAHDPALLARVRRLVFKTGDYNIQLAVQPCWVRAELALGNHAAVANAIWGANYPASLFPWRSTPDAWPLARMLLERIRSTPRLRDELVHFVSDMTAPDRPNAAARFAEVCELSTMIAARVLAYQRWERKVPIGDRLVMLVGQLASPDGDDIVDALRNAAMAGESLAALEPLIDDAVFAGPHAERLAAALTFAAVRTGTPLRYVDDRRPAVRLGVVQALADDPRLIPFARDPDLAVRRAAIEAIGKHGIKPDEIAPLVAMLELAGADLADVLAPGVDAPTLIAACTASGTPAALALAASLRREAPTRACDICRQLPRQTSWSSERDAPKTFTKLETVQASGDDKLLRCPMCSACYTSSYWCRSDVNSMDESWSLQRFTLGEVQRAHGADFVPDWSAALVADLDHPDPHWRSEAAHDLAVDLVTAVQFDRIDTLLLQHSRTQIPREALRVLSERALEAPVPAASLATLAASTDDETRALAATLIAVRRGSPALDELQLDSIADLTRAKLLLDRRAVPSAPFVARLLDRALVETISTWAIGQIVEQAAFTPDHLAATLARLRSALVIGATRHRALELAQKLASNALLDEQTRAIALQQGEVDLEGTLAVALADGKRSLPPALASAALRANLETTKVVQHLTVALEAGEDLRWAVAPLGENTLRFAEFYETAPFLDEMAKRGIDLTDAVDNLTAALGWVYPFAAQSVARALVRHHMRRGETAAVVAVLSDPLPSNRGSAAGALAEGNDVLPGPIVDRLREITTERAWFPRSKAQDALRLRLVR